MMFHLGQQVVCIRAIRMRRRKGEVYPQPGLVYTIRSITPVEDNVFLRFEEICNPPIYDDTDDDNPEAMFIGTKFRPVKPTSIESFRTLLAPQRQRENA